MSISTRDMYARAHLRHLEDDVLLRSIASFRQALRLIGQYDALAHGRPTDNPYVQEMACGLAAMEEELARRERGCEQGMWEEGMWEEGKDAARHVVFASSNRRRTRPDVGGPTQRLDQIDRREIRRAQRS